MADGKSCVMEGSRDGTTWHCTQESILLNDKNNLGEAIVKRNALILKDNKTFEDYWSDVRRA